MVSGFNFFMLANMFLVITLGFFLLKLQTRQTRTWSEHHVWRLATKYENQAHIFSWKWNPVNSHYFASHHHNFLREHASRSPRRKWPIVETLVGAALGQPRTWNHIEITEWNCCLPLTGCSRSSRCNGFQWHEGIRGIFHFANIYTSSTSWGEKHIHLLFVCCFKTLQRLILEAI